MVSVYSNGGRRSFCQEDIGHNLHPVFQFLVVSAAASPAKRRWAADCVFLQSIDRYIIVASGGRFGGHGFFTLDVDGLAQESG